MKIKTSFDYPPIPIRTMDWSAWDDNTYDADCDQDGYFSTSPCGHGATEFEAILDLLTQLEENRVGWPDMLDYTSSPTHAAPMKGGQADNPSLPSSLPSTMSGEPRRAAVIRGGQLTRNNGLNEADRSLLSAEMPTPLYPSCMQCKRFLIPGALYKNGWKDGILLCNRCLRDAHMAGYYAADEMISGREDTEEIQ